jgi:hypothetical protein
MTTPSWLRDVESRAGTLPVLLVEGDDDRLWFEHFLDQYSFEWRRKFAIFPAEGKQKVISGVNTYHPDDWVGIVDMDEGFPDDIQNRIANSRIRTLPRFCLESYFVMPEEIWQALPDSQKIQVSRTDWETSILSEAPAWVAHGAMWRVLRRVYQHNRLPEGLDSEPVTNRARILEILQNWHQSLSPEQVLAEYDRELLTAQQLPMDEQIKIYVHGKKFFRQVTIQKMDRIFHGKGLDYWIEGFRKSQIKPPADLIDLLDWVLGLFP